MTTLIKVECLRLLKSRPFIICLIVSIAIAVLESLALVALSHDARDECSSIEYAMIISGITSDAGLLSAIFVAAFIGVESRDGTIRNKIISGYSRTKIVISYYIISVIFITGVLLSTFLCSLIVYLVEYDLNFVYYSVLYFLDTLLFKALSILFLASLVVFITCSLRGRVLPIILVIAAIYLFVIVGAVTDVFADSFSSVEKLFNFLTNINYIFNSASIGNFTKDSVEKMKYETVDIFRLLIMPIIYTVINLLSIWAIFNRKDFK
ncbi:MAG: ABC transporter permease [Acholeplasmatales bacterium]|nr:ABC transporter permease [Acholeplasmatales bacterium]